MNSPLCRKNLGRLLGAAIILFTFSCDLFDDRQQYSGELIDGTEVIIPFGRVFPGSALQGHPEFSLDGQSIYYNQFREGEYFTGDNTVFIVLNMKARNIGISSSSNHSNLESISSTSSIDKAIN